jgi:hypothetical protein
MQRLIMLNQQKITGAETGLTGIDPMPTKYTRPTLVLNIKREFFAAILAIPRRKFTEYRDQSNYWLGWLGKVEPTLFNLRLLNDSTAARGSRPSYQGRKR